MEGSNFQITTKADWIDKIKKDLKGKSIDSTHWNVDKYFSMPAFYHEDDHIPKIEVKPYYGDYKIVQAFDFNEASLSEKDVLDCLKQGVNAPFLRELEDLSMINQWSNIEWSYLYPVLDAGNLNSDSYHSWMKEHSSTILYESTSLIQLHDINQYSEQLANLLERFTSDQKLSKRIIEVEMGDNYYLNICGIRAIRLCLNQWAHDMNRGNEPFPILANIKPSFYSNEHDQLIELTSKALASAVGTADYLWIHHKEIDTAFQQRMYRNISHILQLESHIGHIPDPASGAYAFDFITKKMADKSWEKFLSKE